MSVNGKFTKQKRWNNFDFESYVKYNENADNSKCLIRNCSTVFKGHSYSNNIARHYDVVHKFIINRLSYIEDNGNDCFKEILNKYYDYNKRQNKSFCKYLDCEEEIEGFELKKLLKHYKQEHDFDIKKEERTKLVMEHYDIKDNKIITNLNDIEGYDLNNKSYRCLFVNCNVFGAENVSEIKEHYVDKHNIIIKELAIIKTDCLFKYELTNIWQENVQASEEDSANVYAKRADVNLKDYVEIFPELNTVKCLLDTCNKPLNTINISVVKKHYLNTHFMHILPNKLAANIEECEELLVQNYNETYIYPLQSFVSDCKKGDDLYKCLFKNCLNFMTKELENIKTHYLQAHNILITKTSEDKSNKKCINYDHLYKNLYLEKSPTKIPHKKPRNNKLYATFVYENYVNYSPEVNMSKCLIKFCKGVLAGRVIGNIKRHYLVMHNFEIYQRLNIESYEKIKQDLTELEFDKFLYQKKCLLTNCLEELQEDWDVIQKHYYEKHKILIEKSRDNPQRKKTKKRKYDFINKNLNKTNDKDDNTSVQSHDNISNDISYESLNDLTEHEDSSSETEPQHEEPETKRLTPNKLYETETYFIETNEDSIVDYVDNEPDILSNDSQISNESNQENQQLINEDTTKERLKFFKLCLGVIIRHDWPLKLFDDAKYLKPLLAPYEQKIEFDINSQKMSELMLRANDVVMEKLSGCFQNKIVCLELYVIRYRMINYVIFNIRYLEKESVQNKIIGYLPITLSTTTLPISEYLKKFNIDAEQIYMKTVLATFQDNEEIYKICDNICKNNADLKTHPLHELQIILRTFKQDYSEELNNWQTYTKYENKFDFDILQGLKDFSKHVKNLIDTNAQLKPQLQNAKHFFKTLQIFWNFYNKFSNEEYVGGDFYRDLLCCETELQNEVNRNYNKYAKNLSEKLLNWKNILMETNEFLAALYFDIRYNFVNTRLISTTQQSKVKIFLCNIWQKYDKVLNTKDDHKTDLLPNADNQDSDDNDEFALLSQCFNDNSKLDIENLLEIWIPTQRENFNFNILNYWRNNTQDVTNIKNLINIVYTFPVSQYVMKNLRNNFKVFKCDTGKLNKFVVRFNQDIFDENEELIFKDM